MLASTIVPEAGPAREALKAQRSAIHNRAAAMVKRSYQSRELEWVSAGYMLWWSFALARPGNLLDGPSFAAFHKLNITEAMWAWIFAIMGASRMIALYINGRWPKGPYIRMTGAMFGIITWPQISWMVSESNLISYGSLITTGTGIYAGLAVMDMLSIFRASRDARYYSR